MAELQPSGGFLGPTLGGAGGNGTSDQFTIITDVAVVPGQPVYIDTATQHTKLGNASALTSSFIAGLIATAGAPGSTVSVAIMRLVVADWTSIVGAANLSIGSTYFLATVAGHLTTIPPSVIGQCSTIVGEAISSTEMKIEIEPPILL